MATEVEIESLRIRLTGDGRSFDLMMNNANASLATTAHHAEESGKKIEGIQQQLKGFAGGLQSALAFVGITSGIHGMMDAWESVERRTIMMTAAMQVHGRQVDQVMGDYKKFAGEMSNVSTVSGGAVMDLLKMAEAHGLTGEAAKNAAKQAISLSYATGRSAETIMHATIAAAEGNTQALRRALGPAARGIKDNQELIAKANELMATGNATMIAITETASGKIEQMQNKLKKVGTEFGRIIDEVIETFIPGVELAVAAILQMPDALKLTILGVLGAAFAMSTWSTIAGFLTPMWIALKSIAVTIWGIGRGMLMLQTLTYGVAVAKSVLLSIQSMWAAGLIATLVSAVISMAIWVVEIWASATAMLSLSTQTWSVAGAVSVATGGLNILLNLLILGAVAVAAWFAYDWGWFGTIFSWIGKQFKSFADALMGEKPKMGDTGAALGAALVGGMAKEMKKLDSVLYGSAESMHRIFEYRERLWQFSPLNQLRGAEVSIGGQTTIAGQSYVAPTAAASGAIGGGGQMIKVEGIAEITQILQSIDSNTKPLLQRDRATAANIGG